MAAPELSAVVIHWRARELLAELLRAWPAADPRFELLVVDNSAADEAAPPPPAPARLLAPGENLGFAGGANAGIAAARAPVVLLLNPDAVPEPGALEELLRGLAAHPEAAGLAPRLLAPDGAAQFAWQLRRLPSAGELLLHTLGLSAATAPAAEPEAGAAVEQPAAAALALRKAALGEMADGGELDEGFFPAWFEDVDLAWRLKAAGGVLRYWPAARFRHHLGSSVPRLGYGPFLWIYHRNLCRYLGKHHGRGWVAAARAAVLLGVALRLAALPLRRPRRARGRSEALAGLAALAAGALSAWRRPAGYARRFRRGGEES